MGNVAGQIFYNRFLDGAAGKKLLEFVIDGYARKFYKFPDDIIVTRIFPVVFGFCVWFSLEHAYMVDHIPWTVNFSVCK